MAKTARQLDREIAQALSAKSTRHATRKAGPFDKPIQFQHNGITYRTNRDATVVEGHDGKKWNRTHSLAVREKALNAIELRDVGERVGARGGTYKPPWLVGRGHARKAAGEASAEAGFAIHTDHEDTIEDNARGRFGPDYGDPKDRTAMMKAGLVDADGKITSHGWEQLNKDIRTLEGNALGWLRKTFGRASDQGHDATGSLIGSVSFDPRSVKQARNIYIGAREGAQERVDFTDASYGDFAGSGAWKGVSDFGQDVLGGSITFFDVQPPEAIEIAEETVDRAARRGKRR